MSVSTAPASASGLYADPREDWLAQYTEEIIDPKRPIVDPHPAGRVDEIGRMPGVGDGDFVGFCIRLGGDVAKADRRRARR